MIKVIVIPDTEEEYNALVVRLIREGWHIVRPFDARNNYLIICRKPMLF